MDLPSSSRDWLGNLNAWSFTLLGKINELVQWEILHQTMFEYRGLTIKSLGQTMNNWQNKLKTERFAMRDLVLARDREATSLDFTTRLKVYILV